jgi:ubiquinone/menaquinone biosynthesis C-methylase UbiE
MELTQMPVDTGGLPERRKHEHEKYVRAYQANNYAMGRARMLDAVADLVGLGTRGAYLDVGCGRGEMLGHAAVLGFNPVMGVEVVPALVDGRRVLHGEVHDLPFPDSMFDTVTMFDVIEHLLPGDDELACRELARVARRHVLVTANNKSSQLAVGEELHINRRSYDQWGELFREWFGPGVTRLCSTGGFKRHDYSPTWRVDLA